MFPAVSRLRSLTCSSQARLVFEKAHTDRSRLPPPPPSPNGSSRLTAVVLPLPSQLSYLKGDPRKPVVLLYPSLSISKKGKKDKIKLKVKPGAGFVVRLLPCCARDVMAPARLAPERNNVRTRYLIDFLTRRYWCVHVMVNVAVYRRSCVGCFFALSPSPYPYGSGIRGWDYCCIIEHGRALCSWKGYFPFVLLPMLLLCWP